MTEQIQCPNCGAFKVSGGEVRYGSPPSWLYLLIPLGLLFVIPACLNLLIIAPTDPNWAELGATAPNTIALGLAIMAPVLLWLLFVPRGVKHLSYGCMVCGYRCTLAPGGRMPKFTGTVRTDLLKAHEEEERRRRMLDW